MSKDRGAVELTPALGSNVVTLGDGTHAMVWSCPGCWSWQLDITAEAAREVFMSLGALYAAVEEVIVHHVAHECDSPRLVAILARDRGLI